ncbi:MAG: hypothetical protein KDA94_13630 [Acidimicrobiales bacterium]|nr:hypothetical protein [Acidimicrobiales bacterium]
MPAEGADAREADEVDPKETHRGDPTARRPRVLIPLTILFAVRYVVRTGLLDRLREHADPVLALSWDDPALMAELESLGVEAVRLPDPRVDATVAKELERLTVHFRRRLRSPSTAIDRARARRNWDRSTWLKRTARQLPLKARTWLPGDERRAERALHAALAANTNRGENEAFLEDLRIDAVVSITPFVSQEQVLLWAAEHLEIPRITSVLSFDNITTRPPLTVAFERYLVWNRFNRAEILRSYPGVSADQIEIVGPAQFDFYAQDRYVIPEAEWRANLGLAAGAPTVLFGAGAVHIAPHEVQHVDQIVAAVRDGRLPADLRIVLRRHPLDKSGRWDRFADEPVVALDDPGAIGTADFRPGHVNLGEDQVVALCSSLAHSDVHVSVSSTMTLDGAFFGRPQIGPAFDASPGAPLDVHARGLYEREHFLPIVASGGMALVHDPEDMVREIAAYLDDPKRHAAERAEMLETMATYTDGRATERIADAIAAFLERLPERAR